MLEVTKRFLSPEEMGPVKVWLRSATVMLNTGQCLERSVL